MARSCLSIASVGAARGSARPAALLAGCLAAIGLLAAVLLLKGPSRRPSPPATPPIVPDSLIELRDSKDVTRPDLREAAREARARQVAEALQAIRDAAAEEKWRQAREELVAFNENWADAALDAGQRAAVAELRTKVEEEARWAVEDDVLLVQPDGRERVVELEPGDWVWPVGDGFQCPYWEGRELRFSRAGQRILVRVDGRPPELAAIVASERGWADELRAALAAGARRFTLACEVKQLDELPPLPDDLDLSLFLKGSDAADLSALARLPQLTALRLYRLSGPDLAPLAKLTRLRSLHITLAPGVRSLHPLAGLRELRSLSLGSLHDVSGADALAPLESLGELTSLTLWYAKPSTHAPLGKLTKLRRLDLLCNEEADIEALGGLVGLRWLFLRGVTPAKGIAPIGRLTRLTDLSCALRFEEKSLAPLEGLSRLRSLELSPMCGQVTDLSVLKRFPRLTSLKLRGLPELTDITVLGELSELTSLGLNDLRKVTDISPLARLGKLETLWLEHSPPITDLAPLSALRGLTTLHLALRKVPDLAPLSSLTALRTLTLGSMPEIAHLNALGPLATLRELRVYEMDGLSDVSGLKRLANVREIMLRNCPGVADLDPFAGLTGLEVLYLYNCGGVRDLGPLARLPKLRYVVINGCPNVTDVRPLEEMALRGGFIGAEGPLREKVKDLTHPAKF